MSVTIDDSMDSGASRRNAYALLLCIAAAIVIADQVAKAAATNALSHGEIVQLLGGAAYLDYARNTGAAFSIFKTGGGVFIALAIVVSALIVVFYRRVASSPLLIRLALGLVLGGALGNLIDRIRLGYVVDFVDLRWWPVFNVADSAIVVGVALLTVASFLPIGEGDHA